MTTKVEYQRFIDDVQLVNESLHTLDQAASLLNGNADISSRFDTIFSAISDIHQWASEKVEALEQEEVNQIFNTFLADLKSLMQVANAKIEIVEGNAETGYGNTFGENYGGAQTEGNSLALKVSIEKDGLSGEKLYVTLPLVSENI